MKQEDLFRIWDRFEKSDCSEFEFESDGARVVLKRMPVSADREKSGSTASADFPEGKASLPESVPHKNETANSSSVVKAPFAGTFYRAPGTGEEPFVSVGSTVRKGDTLGIIEAMKLMNEIRADRDGVIRKICVTNGQVIEYGTELFRITPASSERRTG